MELTKFVEHFAAQFDDTDISKITSSTNFRSIEEWSSLTALSIIAMVDDQYDVQLKGDDIRTSQTVEDIFDIVKSRK